MFFVMYLLNRGCARMPTHENNWTFEGNLLGEIRKLQGDSGVLEKL